MTPHEMISDLVLACLFVSFALRMAKRALFELLPAIKECTDLVERIWPSNNGEGEIGSSATFDWAVENHRGEQKR